MLDPIFNLLQRAQSLQQDFAVEAMDKPETLKLVVELNTREQMYEQGVDSEGRPMGEYSYPTKQKKIEKGQRYDHITGVDTGEMVESERAEFSYNGDLIMTMNTIKDGKDITETYWGVDIVGLTTESQMILKPILTDDIIKATRQHLQGV